MNSSFSFKMDPLLNGVSRISTRLRHHFDVSSAEPELFKDQPPTKDSYPVLGITSIIGESFGNPKWYPEELPRLNYIYYSLTPLLFTGKQKRKFDSLG